VTAEEVDNFRRNIQMIRSPENIFQFFAFRVNHSAQVSFFDTLYSSKITKIWVKFQEQLSRNKDKQKYGTIRGLASKTLKNVSRAAGLKGKQRKNRLVNYFALEKVNRFTEGSSLLVNISYQT
jgi:hypothetical protein